MESKTIYQIIGESVEKMKITDSIKTVQKFENEYYIFTTNAILPNLNTFVEFGTGKNYLVKEVKQRYFVVETADDLMSVSTFKTACSYRYGTRDEINRLVADYQKNKRDLFPLIALITDGISIDTTFNNVHSGVVCGILNTNNKEFSTNQRIENIIILETYKKIFTYSLLTHRCVCNTGENLTYTVQNIFNTNALTEFCDAIELNFNNLITIKN